MLHPYPNGDCIQACMRPPAISWETTTDKLVMTSAMGDITTGDCRLYWAGQAGETTDKTTACKKAGPMSMVCR
jgi:hypothetical protein